MKSTILLWAILLSALNGFCQRTEVLKVFEKYHIDPTPVDSLTRHNEQQFSFDLKTSIVTDGKEKVYLAQHDARKASDSAWILNTVNGGSPSRADRSNFDKQHSAKIPPLMPDYNTYKIVKDDGKELVISFQYDPNSMIDDNKFMKASIVKLFFDVSQARLLRSESTIDSPFKIKMFKANYMASTITYQLDTSVQRYLPQKEEVAINLNLLGQKVDMITVNEYSNYQHP